jgi:hypothetical protein
LGRGVSLRISANVLDLRGCGSLRINGCLAKRESSSPDEFTCDGLNRMVKVVEKTGATINSTRKFVWSGQEKVEFRGGAEGVGPRISALQIAAKGEATVFASP